MSVRNAVQKRDEAAAESNGKPSLLAVVNQAIERQAAVLNAVLPEHMSRTRFEQIALAQIRATKGLVRCFETVPGQTSVLFGVIQAATVGLEIGGIAEECYLIPRQSRIKKGNSWVDGPWEATLQLGYKGVQKLARRDPSVADIVGGVVHEGDTVEHWIDLDGEHFRHYPLASSDAPLTGAYCLIRHVSGGGRAIVLDRAAVEKRRNISTSYQAELRKQRKNPGHVPTGFWFNWEEEMWRKTAVHAAKHALDLAPEIQRVLDSDDQVQHFDAEAVTITGAGSLPELEPGADEPEREHIEVTAKPEPDDDGPVDVEAPTVAELRKMLAGRAKAVLAAVRAECGDEFETVELVHADPQALDVMLRIIEEGK